MDSANLLYTLALQQIPNIGSVLAKKLISHCGSAKAVFAEKKNTLLKIDGIGTYALKHLHDSCYMDIAEKELVYISDNAIEALCFSDSNYPERLKYCIDGPIVLFKKGAIHIRQQPIISIVGTRKITTSGIAFCETLVETLAVYNPVIVSGFAFGTDITAHKAAIKHKLQTIGCLAHGFNQVYPKVHAKYCSAVENNGGFFTEFMSSAAFDRTNFLRRNRIIAGLSQATIVIESAEKGGSLVTADIANSYNRDVFAVPGRTTDSQSVGCNNLIKTQQAHLLSNPLDVPYLLNWQLETGKSQPAIQKQLFVELSADEQAVYNYLQTHHKTDLDTLSLECQMPTYKLASLLLNMELKGVVRPLPGKLFEVI